MRRVYSIFLFQIALLLSYTSFCQLHTYLGFEVATTTDISDVQHDTGSMLTSIPFPTGLWGVNVRRDLRSKLFIQTGINYKLFIQTISFKQTNYYREYSFDYLQVPLSVGHYIKLTNRLSLVPQAGIITGVNITPDYATYGRVGESITFTGAKINHSERNVRPAGLFILVNPSLTLEMKFFDSLLLSVFAWRSWGLTKVSQLDVEYMIDNSPIYRGSIVNNGNFFYRGVSLKYPISKFWQKHE